MPAKKTANASPHSKKRVPKSNAQKIVMKHATEMVRNLHRNLREAGVEDMQLRQMHFSASEDDCKPPCQRVSRDVGPTTITLCEC